MKKATQNPAYHDAKPFDPPPGIVAVPVQVMSTLPGGGQATEVRNEYFIEGTEPQEQTARQGGGGILSRLFHSGGATTAPVAVGAAPPASGSAPGAAPSSDAPPQPDEQKGGVLRRFLSIFKGKNSKPANPPETKKTPPEG